MAQVTIHPVTPATLPWDSKIPDSISLVVEEANGLKKTKVNTDASQGVTSNVQDSELHELFAENVLAKLWRVASRGLENNVSPKLPFKVCTQSNDRLEPPYSIPRIRPPGKDARRCGKIPSPRIRILDLWLLPRDSILPSLPVDPPPRIPTQRFSFTSTRSRVSISLPLVVRAPPLNGNQN